MKSMDMSKSMLRQPYASWRLAPTALARSLPRKRKLTLAACCGVHGVQDGLSAALYVILPTLAQVFGLSCSQVGLICAVNNSA
jgi:hypothetical protein